MIRKHAEVASIIATSKSNQFFAGMPAWLSISALLMFGFVTSQSFAQTTTPGTYADANSSSGAPDPLKMDSIWQVDNITGALSVKIPFGTVPAGGRGPKIPFSLSYNSAATVTLQSQGVLPVGTQEQETFQWAPGNITQSPPSNPIGPWGMSGPTISGSST